jgi:hypothetical protein
MNNKKHIPLQNYFADNPTKTVFVIQGTPGFAPLDINIRFLHARGWSVTTDRLRFHTETRPSVDAAHPISAILKGLKPHILIRKLDKEEDYFVSVQAFSDGHITIMSNDETKAVEFLHGVFLGIPPSFQTSDQIQTEARWQEDQALLAMFCGMLHGAYGWDPLKDTPPFLTESLDEARKSLDIGNYKSTVVMCRRGIEALLKFAYKRLLGKEPVNDKGKVLMLNDLICGFKGKGKIPDHLLHVADSLRVLGNVPGAHAAEIKEYPFTKYDAEFALASTVYFVEQYFTKIDSEVREYYTVQIDL